MCQKYVQVSIGKSPDISLNLQLKPSFRLAQRLALLDSWEALSHSAGAPSQMAAWIVTRIRRPQIPPIRRVGGWPPRKHHSILLTTRSLQGDLWPLDTGLAEIATWSLGRLLAKRAGRTWSLSEFGSVWFDGKDHSAASYWTRTGLLLRVKEGID